MHGIGKKRFNDSRKRGVGIKRRYLNATDSPRIIEVNSHVSRDFHGLSNGEVLQPDIGAVRFLINFEDASNFLRHRLGGQLSGGVKGASDDMRFAMSL